MKKQNQEEEAMAQVVRIDQEECLGCEACVEICPAVFVFDDATGKAFVKNEAKGEEGCVDEAITSCPAGCISKE
jgi:ferredoxin